MQATSVARDTLGVFAIPGVAYGAAFAVAAVVGALALLLVLRLLYRARFRLFAVYVWVLAVTVVATGAV